MLKNDYPKAIADLLGIPVVYGKAGPWMSTEGTVMADWVRAVSARLGVSYQTKVRTMAALVEAVGEVWDPHTMASENTPSQGGGNISTPAFQALLRGLEQRQPPQQPTNGRWELAEGQSVLRVALHNRLGGVRQGGISPSSNYVFLFTDDAVNREHGYLRDHWDQEDPTLFHYCGEGQSGDQQVARYNSSVLNAAGAQRSIRLFQGVRGTVTYVTELIVDPHEPYYWAWGTGRDGQGRRVLMLRLRRVQGTPIASDIDGVPVGLPLPSGAAAQPPPAYDTPYVVADESAAVATLPPVADLELLERATRAHATTQNLLAEWLTHQGLTPLSPGPGQPLFDLAWRHRGRLVVAEVKSLPDGAELTQLRLGLGQVLDYAFALDARPVLALERRPRASRWEDLCSSLGIVLTWPSGFNRILAQP